MFSGQHILPRLIQRLLDVLTGGGSETEITLVNDGNADRSWEVICRLAQEHRWVHDINLMRN